MSKLVSVEAGDNKLRSTGSQATREISDCINLKSLLSLDMERQQDVCELRRTYEKPSASLSAFAKKEVETLVNMTIKGRARRNKVFSPTLFADPAWDMLLALYRSELRQHRISVSNLCVASQVPATTALRWMTNLEHGGLVTRDADPLDGRRIYVRLTAAGSTAMTLYFTIESVTEGRVVCER